MGSKEVKEITEGNDTSSEWAQMLKRDDINGLRQALSQLSVEEAEQLPFGIQNELLRLADSISEKLQRSS